MKHSSIGVMQRMIITGFGVVCWKAFTGLF